MSTTSRAPISCRSVVATLIALGVLALACQPPTLSSSRDNLDPDEDEEAGENARRRGEDSDDPRGSIGTPVKPDGSAPSQGGKDEEEAGRGPDCVESSDCPAGSVCVEGACSSATGCTDDVECATGESCIAGECIEVTQTPGCTKDEECVLGEICEAQSCTPGCHTTYDCPIDQSCFFGSCFDD